MANQPVILQRFIDEHSLPSSYADTANRYFLPLIDQLEATLAMPNGTAHILGINGAQGTGKSTLAALIETWLSIHYQRRVAVLSIDDLYLTQAQRRNLAERIHPLLKTRGVPGTHDVALGCNTLSQLKQLAAGQTYHVPRFDKATDDRSPESQWTTVTGPLDLIIFEGWCVGSQACAMADLTAHQNLLEAESDADAVWRRYVNAQLETEYPALFSMLDQMFFLKAPSFEAVARWRLEQEHKLRDRAGSTGNSVMSDDAVARFIQHYERITRHNIEQLPAIADVVIELDEQHGVAAVVSSSNV